MPKKTLINMYLYKNLLGKFFTEQLVDFILNNFINIT